MDSKVSLIGLSLLFNMQASACEAQQKELKKLRNIKVEIDSFEKMFSVIINYGIKATYDSQNSASENFVQAQIELIGLYNDLNKFSALFTKKQKEWALTDKIYISTDNGIKEFKGDILAALAKAEKENNDSSGPLSESWYDQLKKKRQALTTKQHEKLKAKWETWHKNRKKMLN